MYRSFDEKSVVNDDSYMQQEQEHDAAAILLSDQLMMDDEEDEIFIMNDLELEAASVDQDQYDDDDDEAKQPAYQSIDFTDASFCDDMDDDGLVEENPFEPVYPATAGLLFSENSDKEDNISISTKGLVLEAVSLDNILPAGSRRRRN